MGALPPSRRDRFGATCPRVSISDKVGCFQMASTRWFKMAFLSPNWRSLNPLKGHLTIPKRSLWITRKCFFLVSPVFLFFFVGGGGVANRHVPEKSLQPLDIHCHRNWGSVWLEPKNIYPTKNFADVRLDQCLGKTKSNNIPETTIHTS